MPNWKKVVVSGSQAHLLAVTASDSVKTDLIEHTSGVTAISGIRFDSSDGELNTDIDFLIRAVSRMHLDSSNTTIKGGLKLTGTSAGTDNTVLVLGSDNIVKTDEIDNRVWGSSLTDLANGSNNRVITATDSNSLNGEANLTFDGTDLGVTGNIEVSSEISASGAIYSATKQYWSTTGRLVVGNNTTNYYGPNPQGTNYYYWSRDLGTSSTTITSKTTTLNSGWKLPYKAVLTGYHLNIQGRSTDDNIEFTLVYSDGMWDGDVTTTAQTLVEAESGQTVSIATANNFYELDRRGQFSIPVNAMTMLYPRFKKTAATGGTAYDFQLSVEYYVVK